MTLESIQKTLRDNVSKEEIALLDCDIRVLEDQLQSLKAKRKEMASEVAQENKHMSVASVHTVMFNTMQ